MKPINVGVLSNFPNLFKELRVRLPPEVSLTNVAQSTSCSNSSEKPGTCDFKDVDVIVADYNLIGPYLYSLKNVKFVQGTWAGIDMLMPHIRPDEKLNFPILRFSGAHFGKIISEYVIACIVNYERDIFKGYENQKKHIWSQEGKLHDFRTIYDFTIGVMGIGHIGSRLMNTLKFMGAHIRALGRRSTIVQNDFPYVDDYYSSSQLRDFLDKCDYIINTLPNTDETRGMLNHPMLEVCKENQPVFINVGRGGIISDESLLQALDKNLISYAFLDVFNKEPLPADHPFWNSPKINITSHVAATSRPQDIAEQFVENLKSFQENETSPFQIDFSKGY